ncbi:MAG TPA: benzoylformate decarboxylase [Ktedonobacteraceae bacterium]
MSTIREATYDLLRTLGLTTVFGNPGSTEETFLQNFPSDFSYVLGLQEASVVAMADGYAQGIGGPALVSLHTEAGVGNAMCMIMTAWYNKTPLLITAGQQVREMILYEPLLTNIAPRELPAPFVKWSYQPVRPEDIPAAFMRAYVTALQPPAGPVFLSLPLDDMNKPASGKAAIRHTSRRVEPDADALYEFADILSNSRNPVLILGAALDRSPGGWNAGVKLAEKVRAPVWSPPNSERSGFPENHPLYQGTLPAALGPLSEKLQGHDVALVIGAPAFRYYAYVPGDYLPAGTRLLLVSDDPREVEITLAGDGILGDVAHACTVLTQALREPSTRRVPPPAQSASTPPEPTTPITPDFLFYTLAQVKREDAIIVAETESNASILKRYVKATRPGSFFTGLAAGGLGFDLPAAAGLALAQRRTGQNRQVIAVIGDGAFQYSIQALYTMAQHHLPLTVIVPRNEEYAVLKAFAELEHAPGVPGLDLPGLDIVSQAKGFGVDARSVANPNTLRQVLQAALTTTGPMVVEVPITKEVPPLL